MANEVTNNFPKVGNVVYAKLEASISTVSPVVSVSYIRSNISLAVQTLAAQVYAPSFTSSVSYTSFASNITYTLFSAKIVYGVDDGAVRYVVDSSSLSDAVSLILDKLLGGGDTITLSDGTVIEFVKDFSDSVSVDDTCLVIFSANKDILDAITLTDSVVVNFSTEYYENITTSEVINVGTDKFIADSVNLADFIDIAYIVPQAPSDTTNINDATVFIFNANYLDSVVNDDALAFSFNTSYIDSISVSDSTVFNLNANYTDTVDSSDNVELIVLFDRNFDDSTNFADDLAISSTIVYSDTISIADEQTLDTGKNFDDTLAPTDAGNLIAQGYCDITYFALDYVGEYRTF